MGRLDKKTVLDPDLLYTLYEIKRPQTWYLLVEPWCGDAAQNLPVLAKIAQASDKIDLKLLLRDENPEIMDGYLTNGTRSIPKLICVDTDTGREIGTWGPRPSMLIDEINRFRTENPACEKQQFLTHLHLWYGRNKGQALQEEMVNVIESWCL